jgi:hypothetical protein
MSSAAQAAVSAAESLRVPAAMGAAALLAFAILSAFREVNITTPGYVLITIKSGGIDYGRRSVLSVTKDEFSFDTSEKVKIPIDIPGWPVCDIAVPWSATRYARRVSLWHPIIILAAYASFAIAYSALAGPRPPRLWFRLVLTVLAATLSISCITFRNASHKYYRPQRYVAFTGGGFTIGQDHPHVGAYRLPSYATLTPRCQGARALEFPDAFHLYIPLWHAALVVTLWSAALWGRAIRFNVQSEKLCTTCGYSLRGLAAPMCPECGNVIPV